MFYLSIVWLLMQKWLVFLWYILVSVLVHGIAMANTFYYQSQSRSSDTISDSIANSATDAQWPIQQLLRIFLPWRPVWETLVSYIQYIIDVALGFVALIAVLVLLYGFYWILFTKSEDGISNAKKVVQWTVMALFIMWASWLIVRWIFYLITLLQ